MDGYVHALSGDIANACKQQGITDLPRTTDADGCEGLGVA